MDATDGPDRLALVCSMMDRRPVAFTTKRGIVEVMVNSIEMESGNGFSFNLEGYFVGGPSDIGVAKLYYHAGNRVGRFEG